MLTFEEAISKMEKAYNDNSSFYRLATGLGFPYKISLKAPSSSAIAKNFNEVFQEVSKWNKSPLKPYIVYTKKNVPGFGAQNVPSSIVINNRIEFEDVLRENVKSIRVQWEAAIKAYVKDHGTTKEEALSILSGRNYVQDEYGIRKDMLVVNAAYDLVASDPYNHLDELPEYDPEDVLTDERYSDVLNKDLRFLTLIQKYIGLKEKELEYSSKSVTEHCSQVDPSHIAKVLNFKMIPGSFMAFDEAAAHLYRPLYPKFPEFRARRRSGSYEYCVANEAKNFALNPRRYILAMQFADFVVSQESFIKMNLREIALHYMHTKFVEENCSLIDILLKRYSHLPMIGQGAPSSLTLQLMKALSKVQQGEPLDLEEAAYTLVRATRRKGIASFLASYGFGDKQDFIRMRSLDHELSVVTGTDAVNDVSINLQDIQKLELNNRFKKVLIVENEASYLSIPALKGTLLVFGGGYHAVICAYVASFHKLNITYWGDLDTHGFGCLNALREAMYEVKLANKYLELVFNDLACCFNASTLNPNLKKDPTGFIVTKAFGISVDGFSYLIGNELIAAFKDYVASNVDRVSQKASALNANAANTLEIKDATADIEHPANNENSLQHQAAGVEDSPHEQSSIAHDADATLEDNEERDDGDSNDNSSNSDNIINSYNSSNSTGGTDNKTKVSMYENPRGFVKKMLALYPEVVTALDGLFITLDKIKAHPADAASAASSASNATSAAADAASTADVSSAASDNKKSVAKVYQSNAAEAYYEVMKNVRSIMMDEQTLSYAVDNVVIEDKTASKQSMNFLSASELDTFEKLSDSKWWAGLVNDAHDRKLALTTTTKHVLNHKLKSQSFSVRLEQERIPFNYVLQEIGANL